MKKLLIFFLTGGTVYAFLEVLFRGWTHISMFLAGGTSLVLIDRVCNRRFARRPLAFKCIVSSGIITLLELITGLIVNVKMKLDVWDYSSMPFNFRGQICLLFTVLWCFLSIPAIYLCKVIGKKMKD